MSDLESKRLDDDALEEVTGGGFFSGLVFRNMGGRRREKLFTLEQKGKGNNWTLNTLEQKDITESGVSQEFTGMSKL